VQALIDSHKPLGLPMDSEVKIMHILNSGGQYWIYFKGFLVLLTSVIS
jgi:hypothetical protein